MNQRVNDIQSFFKEEYNLDINESEVIKIIEKLTEILSVDKYYEDELSIKKDDYFLCIKNFEMADGTVAFTEGNTYFSPEDGNLINVSGNLHFIPEKCIKEHFRNKRHLLKR